MRTCWFVSALRSEYTNSSPGTIAKAQTLVAAAGIKDAVTESAKNSWRRAAPAPNVSPPYWVISSSVPSSCRWSCFNRRPLSVRVKTQVRDLSSPTWKGIGEPIFGALRHVHDQGRALEGAVPRGAFHDPPRVGVTAQRL